MLCRRICACVGIAHARGLWHWYGVCTGGGYYGDFVVWQLVARAVPLPFPFPLSFHCFNSVMGAGLSYCMGTHGWIARIYQP